MCIRTRQIKQVQSIMQKLKRYASAFALYDIAN